MEDRLPYYTYTEKVTDIIHKGIEMQTVTQYIREKVKYHIKKTSNFGQYQW